MSQATQGAGRRWRGGERGPQGGQEPSTESTQKTAPLNFERCLEGIGSILSAEAEPDRRFSSGVR